MALKRYQCSALTGGGTGALDRIDGANLADGDMAEVITSTGAYWYRLNATSSAIENSPFRINPDTNAGTKSWHLVGTTARIGALVYLTSNKSVGASSTLEVPWDSEIYDDANFWEGVINPARFTIPIGVTSVKLHGNSWWDSSADANPRNVSLFKNGATFTGRPLVEYANVLYLSQNFSSEILSVSSGDYFTLRVKNGDTSAHVLTSGDFNWFSIEAVGFA